MTITHLKPQSGFHPTNTPPFDVQRFGMSVHKRTASGALSLDAVASYKSMIVPTLSEDDRDLIQIVPASDANKLFVYGQEVRLYSVSGIVPDTNLATPLTIGADSWDGHGYRELLQFVKMYANVGACAAHDWRVRVSYMDTLLIGAVIQLTAEFDTISPNAITVGIQLVVFDRPVTPDPADELAE